RPEEQPLLNAEENLPDVRPREIKLAEKRVDVDKPATAGAAIDNQLRRDAKRRDGAHREDAPNPRPQTSWIPQRRNDAHNHVRMAREKNQSEADRERQG